MRISHLTGEDALLLIFSLLKNWILNLLVLDFKSKKKDKKQTEERKDKKQTKDIQEKDKKQKTRKKSQKRNSISKCNFSLACTSN